VTRIALLTLAVLMVLAALFFARPRATAGPPMRDFEAYYAAGTAFRHGRDPYGENIWNNERVLTGVNPQRHELLPFVGPPATLPFWSEISHVPFSAANTVWRVFLIVSLAALVLAALRLAGISLSATSFLAAAVFALGFGPVTSCIALGQVALPAYAFTMLALIWPAFTIFAWIQPNVAFALASQAATRKGAIVFVAGGALFAAACFIVGGVDGVKHYVGVLQAHAHAEQFSAIQVTPAAIAYGLGAPTLTATAIGICAAITALTLWIVLMRTVRDGVARFCGTCALLPLGMQFFHEHDLVVAFLPALYFATRCNVRTWSMVAVGTLLCATDWLGLAQRPDGAVQTLLLVGAAALALFVLRRDVELRSLLAPMPVLALIIIAAFYAQAHPAPIWPDAMHTVPPLTGDTASIWHAEQAATGLLARNGFWALLRCASLTGSAMLVYASLVSSRSLAGSKNPWPVPA
jgi:hypothetical protein